MRDTNDSYAGHASTIMASSRVHCRKLARRSFIHILIRMSVSPLSTRLLLPLSSTHASQRHASQHEEPHGLVRSAHAFVQAPHVHAC